VKVYFDSAVLIAGSVMDHPHHHPAAAALALVRDKKIEGWLTTHAMAEVYAVLTRTPFTPRVSPSEAWQLLTQNILPHFEVTVLSAKDYQDAIHGCATQGWTGGRVYDPLHLRAAQKAGCDQIYTFNVRHFQQLAPELANLIRTP
jgi:predicted nucleic acid-binding protein